MLLSGFDKTCPKVHIFSLRAQHPPIFSAKPSPASATEARNCGTGNFYESSAVKLRNLKNFKEFLPQDGTLESSQSAKLNRMTVLPLPTLPPFPPIHQITKLDC